MVEDEIAYKFALKMYNDMMAWFDKIDQGLNGADLKAIMQRFSDKLDARFDAILDLDKQAQIHLNNIDRLLDRMENVFDSRER